MPKFKPYDYSQNAMVVINFADQLQPGTFEHTIHTLIDTKLDLSIFHPNYQNDDNGRPAYDPAILLKIILFAYAKGITSSREIQWCCETNILFKALSCDTVPHFTTIAHFVSSHADEIEALFEQFLLICHQQGLLGNELFAIDGQAFGAGQEHHTLQPILESVRRRCQRLNIRKDIYKGRSKPIITADTGFANETNMQYLKTNKVNAYIPDNQFRSRDPRFAGHREKYGKKPAVTGKPWDGVRKKGVLPASEFRFDAKALTCICPQGEHLSYRGTRINADGDKVAYFAGRLLQCRHCPKKQACMYTPASADHPKGHGRQVSFVLKRADNRKSNTPYTDWMKARVDSEKGREIYSHRMSVVEPVFGNIGTNKGLNRFSLRSKKNVQGQWQLYYMVHNIEKLMNYGTMVT